MSGIRYLSGPASGTVLHMTRSSRSSDPLSTNPVSTDPVSTSPEGVTVAVKVVPNASRNEVVGLHGDRLKVRVTAAPERGKANDAVCALLTKATGAATVTVIAGGSHPHKTVLITGVDAATVRRRLTVER